MPRYRGKLTNTNTYDVQYYGPLDTRQLVPKYEDLTNTDNWTVNKEDISFNGMIVAVGADADKGGIYFLFDKSKLDESDYPDASNEANWYKLATVDEVNSVSSTIELLSKRIEEVSNGILTADAINNLIVNQIPTIQDEFDKRYAQKGEIPSVAGLATKQEVSELKTEITNANYIKLQDLSNIETIQKLISDVNSLVEAQTWGTF